MQNGRKNAMKRKIHKFMMKFCYKMACRSDWRMKFWCRWYTEFAVRYCREGGDSDEAGN